MFLKAWPQITARRRRPLGAGGDDVFLPELLQHEAARHAADIGDRVIAEERARQDDMGERARGTRPSRPAIAESTSSRPVTGVDHAFVEDVDPARGRRPI